MNSEPDNNKKQPRKNLTIAIRNAFSGLISCSSSPSVEFEPKSAYNNPKRSRYECPCDGHHRKREKQRQRLEANSTQHHHDTAEHINMHSQGNSGTGVSLISDGNKYGKEHDHENNGTGVSLISDGTDKYAKEHDHENGDKLMSMDDAYALLSLLQQDNDAVADILVLDDVDERAEKFIQEFREQLRIQAASFEKSFC